MSCANTKLFIEYISYLLYIYITLSADIPAVLSGNEVVPRIQTGAAGQAWFSLDKHCDLHYHLVLAGINRGRTTKVKASLTGYADYGEIPQPYDENVYSLRTFFGEMVSGIESFRSSNCVKCMVGAHKLARTHAQHALDPRASSATRIARHPQEA